MLDLTKGELNDCIEETAGGFILKSLPDDAPPAIQLGEYELPRRRGETHIYRLSHPLAQWLIRQAKGRHLSPAQLTFNYGATETQVAVIKALRGQSGQLQAHLVTVESLERSEDHIVLCGQTDDGVPLHQEVLEKLLGFPVVQISSIQNQQNPALAKELVRRKNAILTEVNQRNLIYFEAEVEKLDTWSDDLKVGLEHEIKELDKQIKEVRRSAKAAPDLNEKLSLQKRQRELEKLRSRKRRELFDKQDEVDARREQLIGELEDKLEQRIEQQPLFSISWSIV